MSPRNPSITARPSRGALDLGLHLDPQRTFGQLGENLIDQGERLLDLFDANPDAGIDIAFRAGRDFEGKVRIRRIGKSAARVEGSSGCAADETAAAILAREIGAQNSRADGAVLQRCGEIIDVDEMREALADLAEQRFDYCLPLGGEIMGHAARHNSIHHQPMAEAKVGRA